MQLANSIFDHLPDLGQYIAITALHPDTFSVKCLRGAPGVASDPRRGEPLQRRSPAWNSLGGSRSCRRYGPLGTLRPPRERDVASHLGLSSKRRASALTRAAPVRGVRSCHAPIRLQARGDCRHHNFAHLNPGRMASPMALHQFRGRRWRQPTPVRGPGRVHRHQWRGCNDGLGGGALGRAAHHIRTPGLPPHLC